ncbi:hypothetical protein L915_04987 [Plasmopara halstedii]|uniref:PRELI/MSF1 domain-containing protein n=1 Tax=Plasmopara halstedii TaxID=4781 RepID=A0A0P1A8E4_PLAHL|nr:hypothetical protein L915_04987 [Plasmopara halstedii]CEG36973.1 hypothetical protein L915_04987 [Plasmopara halstedii]|eukprot:XP_024573342.1 hypothetical protein L915_04987 [Plasmopara halstedii]
MTDSSRRDLAEATSDEHNIMYEKVKIGDCTEIAPSVVFSSDRAQWLSWYKSKGLSQQDAENQFLQLVRKLSQEITLTAEQNAALEPRGLSARIRQRLSGQSLWQLQILTFLVFAIIYFVAVEMWRRSTKTPIKQVREKLLPLLWFAFGYAIVILLQSKSFLWPKRLQVSSTVAKSNSHIKRRRLREPKETELGSFLRNHRIQIHQQPNDGYTVPRLALVLPRDQDAFQFGDCTVKIPYTVEQTADVYYRKFKEPLPDPASRLLIFIEVLEERQLDDYCAVFKRRLLRFRNEAPSLIKRFVNSDFVEYIEDSLLDKQNRIFYVYIRNKSFQSLGVLEDFSVYEADAEKSHWTRLHQCCRVHITSSSLAFFRPKIESFISNFYCKNAPDARSYHLKRIREEYGD